MAPHIFVGALGEYGVQQALRNNTVFSLHYAIIIAVSNLDRQLFQIVTAEWLKPRDAWIDIRIQNAAPKRANNVFDCRRRFGGGI